MKTMAMDARRMRRHNSEQVLRIVRHHGPLSRTEIARHSHLSAPTVAAAIASLVRVGMVGELGEGKSTGGRRPQLVSFNARFGAVVGGYVGATAIRLVLADVEGREIAKRVVPSGEDTRPEPLLALLAESIRELRRDGSDVPLLATVIGAPGMTDMDRGVVLEAANLEGWVQVPARDILERALESPVFVDNDVNLAAIGEHWHGGRTSERSFVFITLATGIGAGIIIDGKVHRGHRWNAGEISHLNVDFREWDGDFGAAGYLETYLGGAPPKRASRRLGALDDEGVLRLGAAIANIATIVDPESIVLGGRVAASHPDLIIRVSDVAKRIAPNCPELGLTVLGDDAPLFGGVKLALDHVDELLPQYLVEA
jgi:glucokinase